MLCLLFELLYFYNLIELTEYLTLFGFAMLLMEYKPAFQLKKVFKNVIFGQRGPHLLWADPMRRSDCNLSLNEFPSNLIITIYLQLVESY